MSNINIPLVHFQEATNKGQLINLLKVCAIRYNYADYEHQGKPTFHFEVVLDGGGETYFDAPSLEAGLAKLGISLSGLTIVK